MIASLLAVLVVAASASEGADTVVVCPAEFCQALEPWLEYRRSQGHRIAILSNTGTADELRASVRRLAAGGTVRFLVLVGDADPRMDGDPAIRSRSVPVHYSRAEVNVRFGSTPEIATDNWYADLDDDRLPDVAVGRIPADSAAELARMVDRILAYERSSDFGHWRRQVHFVAGLGGFGPVADTVMEAAAKSLISQGIPAAFCTTMTYGSWQSPYCPDPREFRDVTLGRLNEGSLFWVYLGHGQHCAVDEVRVAGRRYPILSTDDAQRLACQHGAPIACFLACYSGAFDLPRDCLAEEMLRADGGPVAILCGSRVTMPYAMTVMGSELLAEVFNQRAATLGEALLAAKRATMQTENLGRYRTALDAMARLMSPTADALAAERAEHLDLFNLLGDPLLRIPYPKHLELEVEHSVAAGGRVTVRGNSPLAGSGVIELAVRRDRLTFRAPRREPADAHTLDGYAEVYQRANDPRLSAVVQAIAAGAFAIELAVPAEAEGACQVRVFVEGETGCAAGGADLVIQSSRAAQAR